MTFDTDNLSVPAGTTQPGNGVVGTIYLEQLADRGTVFLIR